MTSPKKASELSEKTTVSQDVKKTDETQTETAVNADAENQTSIIQDNTNANKNETAKKPSRIERRIAKLKNTLTSPVDIKYRGPLSYRYLRIIAWIAIAAGQIIVLNSASTDLIGLNMLSVPVSSILSVISGLSFPLFLIAAFGLILKTNDNYKKILTSYGLSFIAIGLGITILYLRYISSVLVKIGVDGETIAELGQILGTKVEVNVFSDLFAFALFHFFLNYTPKKHFLGKKIAIFRLFGVFPILFIVASYVIKVLFEQKYINLPFFIFPFLTTKSPLVFMLFSVISLLIKNRERTFRKIGLSQEAYQRFLKTNRNSLYFSITLSIVILVFALIEILLIGALAFNFAGTQVGTTEQFIALLKTFKIGECMSMLLAIPIVFLYSYTKEHKGAMIDRFMPILGLLLIVFIYVEGFYRFIMIVA